MNLITLRRRIVIAAVLCAVLVVGTVLSAIGYVVKRAHDGSSADLDALLADLSARGEPVAFDDLVGPPLAEEDDGAPILREAWAWLDESAPPRDEWPTSWKYDQGEFDALPEAERAREVAFVALVEPFLVLVYDAVERPGIRVWDRRMSLLAPDPTIGRVQTTQRFLIAALRVSATPDERLRALRASGLFGAHLERPTDQLSTLVVVAVIDSAVLSLRESLEGALMRAADARVALDDLLQCDIRSRVDWGLRCERVHVIAIVRTMVGDEKTVPEYDGPIVTGWMAGLTRSSLTEFVVASQELLDAAHDRWSDLGRATVVLAQRMDSGLPRRDPGGGLTHASAVLAPLIIAKGAQVAATQSLARLSLAAVAHYEVSGAWPESLQEIDVPAEVRSDPLSDAPFLFERLPDGIRLSSPGLVDADAWGARNVADNDPQKDGLVWTLRR